MVEKGDPIHQDPKSKLYFHFKWVHAKFILNGSFDKVWWKCKNQHNSLWDLQHLLRAPTYPGLLFGWMESINIGYCLAGERRRWLKSLHQIPSVSWLVDYFTIPCTSTFTRLCHLYLECHANIIVVVSDGEMGKGRGEGMINLC